MTRRGFTLVELLVAMALMAILGTALARLLLSNSRFVALQEAQLDARQTARAAMNLMTTELRMVSDSGVVAADPTDVTVRVPYAFGVFCGSSGGSIVAVLMPADSAVYASAAPDGLARRQANGRYTFIQNVTVNPSTAAAACDADSVRMVPGGRRVAITPDGIANPGDVFYLYQTVRYRFAPSTILPGRIGLFRQVNGGAEQELLAPWNAAAGFGFLVGAALTLQNAPPANLDAIQGLELRLVAESEHAPSGVTGVARFSLRPRVKFVNHGP